MAFSFVHTADIHLDSPLKSMALRDPGLAELIGTATRTTFARIVDLCLDQSVNALLIAGDLYDSGQTSMKTARFLLAQLDRLAQAGVAVFLIRGNHDSASRITKELEFPENVHVFPGRAGVQMQDWNGHDVAIHGVSFRDPHAPDSLLPLFKQPVTGAFNIGMLHTSLGGASGHDPYAPCSLADLRQTGFDYWALGHIHERAVHNAGADQPIVVMPGIPQGRDIGEAGAKSVTLVRVNDAGKAEPETHCLAVARFERVPVACDGITDWTDLVRTIGSVLGQARRSLDGEYLIVRPQLTGVTPLAWRMVRDADLLLSEAQAAAEAIGSLWIDKLSVETTAKAPTTGAVAELQTLVLDGAIAPQDRYVQAELEMLQKALPKELRCIFGQDEAAQSDVVEAALQQGAKDVLARLVASSSEDPE